MRGKKLIEIASLVSHREKGTRTYICKLVPCHVHSTHIYIKRLIIFKSLESFVSSESGKANNDSFVFLLVLLFLVCNFLNSNNTLKLTNRCQYKKVNKKTLPVMNLNLISLNAICFLCAILVFVLRNN